jgi:hypothetical protein
MTGDIFHGTSILDAFNENSLTEGLDASARRRFWLVAQFISRCGVSDIESAISASAKVEAFIANGDRSSGAPIGPRNAAASVSPDPIKIQTALAIDHAPSPIPAVSVDSKNVIEIGGKYRNVRRQLLDKDTRTRFIQEAAINPDNRHLAQIFGLSVRQAHAVRVGLSKFIAAARRETELKMQHEFLRNKSAAGATIDDVVRYLRQINDVVVPNGQDYIVNYKLTLTAEQLLERANAKRRERSQQPLVIEGSDALYETSAD